MSHIPLFPTKNLLRTSKEERSWSPLSNSLGFGLRDESLRLSYSVKGLRLIRDSGLGLRARNILFALHLKRT